MDRQQLARLLERDGEAFAACRQAVLACARFWVDEQSQPASTLVPIYDRRDRLTQRQGVLTVGFTSAVDQLRAWEDGLVRIGAVDHNDPPYHFQLFLNEAATVIVACIGLDQSLEARRPGSKRTLAG